jgi:AraC-like DNA-binding protein/mannose-6-phosphate isomerase-like protein (cupin superfamily)
MRAERDIPSAVDPPRGEALRAAFPWASSRTLQFTAQGEFPLNFPPECPLQLHCLQFSVEHRLTPSYHEHLEISYVFEGRGAFVLESRRYPLEPGDLVVVGRREFHLIEAEFPRPLRALSLHFMPELVHPPGGAALDFEYLRPFHHHGAGFSHRVPAAQVPGDIVLDRLWRVHEEITGRRPDYPLAVKTHLCDLLLVLSRLYRRHGGGTDDHRPRDFERLRDVFSFIRKNCHEPVSLRQMARLAHLSPQYFCRFFKAVTGTTMTEYVLRMRVDLAMEFLSSSAMSVTEIAYAAGFSSHSYFDRVFKRLKGVTPQEYRRQLKG